MNTLHLFGDSFTEGHKLDLTFKWYKVWEEMRDGNLPPVWHELLSTKLNMKCNVNAIGGSSNDETFHTICQKCDSFERGDIVIIQWTYNHRFRWASEFHDENGVKVINPVTGKSIPYWIRMGITIGEHCKFYIKESTQLEIAINRSEQELYADEIYDFEKIIDLLCNKIGCEVYYWSMDEKIINSLPKEKLNQKKYICNQYIGNYEIKKEEPNIGHHFTLFREIYKRGGMNIQQETNYEIPDTHLGESGHRIQYEMFYEYLSNIKTPTNKLI
jgi:hypothetical protein